MEEDINELGECEREILDNVSWDSASDEEKYYEDEESAKLFHISPEPKKKKSRLDLDQTENTASPSPQRLDSDYYDFFFHDMKKSYVESTPEYDKYRSIRKVPPSEQQQKVPDFVFKNVKNFDNVIHIGKTVKARDDRDPNN